MSALIDTSTVRKFAVGLDHPEGVAVLSTGEVVAGGEAGQLYLIELDGAVTEVGSTGGFMLGLCVDAEDNVFVADTGNGVVWTWSKNGDLVRFCPSNPDERFRQPNALALSAAGLYLSDSGVWDEANGTIHLLKSDGSSLVVGDEFPRFPNGLAVSPDGAWLYVVESQFGVSRAAIHADGRLGTREVVHSSSPATSRMRFSGLLRTVHALSCSMMPKQCCSRCPPTAPGSLMVGSFLRTSGDGT